MILFKRTIETMQRTHAGKPFEVTFWSGERKRFGAAAGPPEFVLHFKTRTAFVRSILQTSLGFGEAYVSGEMEVDGNLEDVITDLAEHGLRMQAKPPEWVSRVRRALAHPRSQERGDDERHHGLGEAFYEMVLGSKLQYSCAYFRTAGDSLEQAQDEKITRLARKLDLRRGQRLLDIGCGWGHLMFHAAERYGVECVGVTLSESQARYVREQSRARGLPVEVHRANVLDLDDRRKWDRIVSVGMMCQVGESRADAFYDKLQVLSAPGAIVLTHCVSKMRESSRSDPFMAKHVFPAYWLFSLEGATKRAVERGFNVLDVENFRRHYALTAHQWRKNLLTNARAIKRATGRDDRFIRTWDYYLASVVGGFRSGYLNSIQMTMSSGINDDYPLTRELVDEDRERPRASPAKAPPIERRAEPLS